MNKLGIKDTGTDETENKIVDKLPDQIAKLQDRM